MTRKSQREIERALDGLDEAHTPPRPELTGDEKAAIWAVLDPRRPNYPEGGVDRTVEAFLEEAQKLGGNHYEVLRELYRKWEGGST